MTRGSHKVQIPGAPVAQTDEEEQDFRQPKAPADPRDAEIAALRAQLAEANAHRAPASADALVFEPVTPHMAEAIRLSKHRHLTCAQLDAEVRGGKAELTERHVLCKDGWYVNPYFDAKRV